MNHLRKQMFQIIALLVFIWVFQGCQVYYKTTASVEQAANAPEDQWIKVKMKNGKVYNFRSIYEKNNHLFGRTTKKGEYVLFATTETLESLRLQNKELSIVGNALILIGVGVLVGLFLWNEYGPKFEFGTFFTGM